MRDVEIHVQQIVGRYCERFVNTRWHLEDPDRRKAAQRELLNWTAETYFKVYGVADSEKRYVYRQVAEIVNRIVQEIAGGR